MSLAGNITLLDAQPTPVSHVFNYIGTDRAGVSHWEDRSNGVPIGNWRISMSVRPPIRKKGSLTATGVYRNTITLSEPVMENVTNSTISGIEPAPTVAYIPRMELVYLSPERSSTLARANMHKMFANLLLSTAATSVLEDNDQPRG